MVVKNFFFKDVAITIYVQECQSGHKNYIYVFPFKILNAKFMPLAQKGIEL